MTSIKTKATRWWPALSVVAGVAACGGITDSTAKGTRIVLDARSLVGAQAAPGNFASVVASANLTIVSGGQQTNLTRALADNDPAVTFDVAVETGTAAFTMDVLSNNQTRLYRGEASAAIENDGFTVPITLRAVNPMMVISPRSPGTGFFVVTAGGRDSVTIHIHNPGLDSLKWTLDPDPPLFSCTALPDSLPCLAPDSVALAGGGQDSALVIFAITAQPRPTSLTIVFGSNVGRASLDVRIPVLIGQAAPRNDAIGDFQLLVLVDKGPNTLRVNQREQWMAKPRCRLQPRRIPARWRQNA